MDEEIVGVLGIDVQANVGDYEREAGEQLKQASIRIGREAGRSMGAAMSDAAGVDRTRAKSAGQDLADQIIAGAKERLQRGEALAAQLKLADRDLGEKEGRRVANDFRKEIMNGIRKLDELGVGDSAAFGKLAGALKEATKEGFADIPQELDKAAVAGADAFTGRLSRMLSAFLTRGGTSIRNIFRISAQEAGKLNREVDGAGLSMKQLAGAAGVLLGVLLTITGIRALWRFAEDAKRAALETDKANAPLQAMQDSLAGLSDLWQKFKVAVGTALLEMQGVERTTDIIGAILSSLTEIINENTGAWKAIGRGVAVTAEWFFRLGAIVTSGVIGPLGLLIKTLALTDQAFQGLRNGVAWLAEKAGQGGLADAIRQGTAEMRKESDAMLELANSLIEKAEEYGQIFAKGFEGIADVKGAGATTTRQNEEAKRAAEQAVAEAKRLAAERLRIEEDLQDQLFALTATTTEEAIRQLDKMVEEYREARGDILKIAGPIEALKESLRLGDTIADFRTELSRLADAGVGPEALGALGDFRDRVLEQRDAIDQTHDRWRELDEIIKQVDERLQATQADAAVFAVQDTFNRTMNELREKLARGLIDEKQFKEEGKKAGEAFKAGILAAIDELRSQGVLTDEMTAALLGKIPQQTTPKDDRLRELRDQARGLEENARAALQVAEAFGLIDSEAAQALQSVAQLAASIARIAGGDLSAIPAALGAVASMVGGLFGDSPEERQRKQELHNNTRALERLSRGLAELSGLRGESGRAIGGVGAAAASASDALFPQRRFNAELAALGITMEEAERIARSLGITLNGTRQSFEDLSEAVKQTTLDMLYASAEGREEMMRREERLLEIEDPQEQLERRREFLIAETNLSEEDRALLMSFDLSSPEGRAMMRDFMLELFRRIQEGEITAAELGNLSPNALLGLTEEIVALTRRLEEDSGVSEGFNVVRTITETTAGRMVGTLTTISAILGEYQKQIALNTAGILAALSNGALPDGGTLPVAGPIRIDQAFIPPPPAPRQPLEPTGAAGAATTSPTIFHFEALVQTLELRSHDIDPSNARFVGEDFARAVIEVLGSPRARSRIDSGLADNIDEYRRARGLRGPQ